VVSGQTLSRARALGLDPEIYLANNDSHHFFMQLEDCLTPGPTRTNVNDLLFLFCFSRLRVRGICQANAKFTRCVC